MSREVFRQALQLTWESDQFIVLGGGEPTVHPLFWQFLGLALQHFRHEANVLVVTNGRRTNDALALACLARRGTIAAELSLDEWHEAVDHKVVQAFRKTVSVSQRYGGTSSNSHDLRGLRTVRTVLAAGRARDWGDDDGCVCDELFCEPRGHLYRCGCKLESLGTVFDPRFEPDELTGCSKEDNARERTA